MLAAGSVDLDRVAGANIMVRQHIGLIPTYDFRSAAGIA